MRIHRRDVQVMMMAMVVRKKGVRWQDHNTCDGVGEGVYQKGK